MSIPNFKRLKRMIRECLGHFADESLPARSPARLSVLEPRILYSASPIDAGVDGATVVDVAHDAHFADQFEPYSDVFLTAFDAQLLEPLTGPITALPTEQHEPLVRELVLVNDNIENLDQLIEDLLESFKGRQFELVTISQSSDGIAQVNEILKQYSSFDSIHVFSHGSAGQINLGNAWLDAADFSSRLDDLSAWGNALTADGDLLFYGCDLAGDESGRDLLRLLADVTRADVAASDDLTGNSLLSGNWNLEFVVGDVMNASWLSVHQDWHWAGVLAGNVVVVDTTNDVNDGNTTSIAALLGSRGADGKISLREAILAANSSPNVGGPDEIQFAIPDNDPGHYYYRNNGTAGTFSAAVTTTLSDASITDFDTDYPYTAHSWFRFNLNNALPQLLVSDTVIINGYSQPGASVNTMTDGQNANIRIELTNTAADGNQGLTFDTGSTGSILKGLAINRFGGLGVLVDYNVHGVTVQGNFIGTDITGTVDLGNGDSGIQVRSNNNQIGGPDLADRNLVSGNASRGVVLFNSSLLTGNVIQNNYIGTDSTGLKAIANDTAGIQLYNSDGTQVVENVISGNGDGIWFRSGAGVQNINNIVTGNKIGLGANGTTIVGNNGDGILIESGSMNTIGGTTAATANYIAGNVDNGIHLTGSNSFSNVISGNFIGLNTALGAAGNLKSGVQVESSSSNNRIGDTTNGSGNRIAFNQEDGVRLQSSAGNRNSILGNSIYSNTELGIDLDNNGVTSNDVGDGDSGVNGKQNFPEIAGVTTDGISVTIGGWFNSLPLATYRLEFFSNSALDPSGFGEGETYLGFVDVTTDANGIALFNNTFATVVAAGNYVSATATDSSGNTSELGRGFRANIKTATANGVWISTHGNVSSPSGAPGLNAWSSGQVLSFGGPSLNFTSGSTAGTFASALNLGQLGDGNVVIDSLHYVTTTITVGSGPASITLMAGDLLLSTESDESFLAGTFNVEGRDLFLYRPLLAGDYSIGKLQMVLDMDSPTLSVPSLDPDLNINDLGSVTLVAHNVSVGGYALNAGEFLFTRDGGSNEQDIYVFHVTGVGAGATSGTADKLIEGNALGFNDKIRSLELVERTITVGGKTLTQGTILFSLKNDTTILDADGNGANDLVISRNEMVAVQITQTELNGGTQASSAEIIFRGSDVGLDTDDESFSSFTFLDSDSGNSPPTDIGPNSFAIVENTNTTGGFSLGVLTVTDPDVSDTFTFQVMPGSDGPKFSIGGAGFNELIITDGMIDYERQSIYSVNIRVTDSSGNTYDETLTVSVTNVDENPVANAGGPYVINEGSGVTLNGLGSTDPEGGPLTCRWDLDNDGIFGDVIGSNPPVPWATLVSRGLTNQGTFTIGLETTDAGGNRNTTTTTLTINNLAPTANSDSGVGFTRNEDTPFLTGNVLANDSDPNSNDTLSVTGMNTGLTLGLVTNNGDGTFTYNPNGQFENLKPGDTAFDSFVYFMQDEFGATSSTTVTVTINGVNDEQQLVTNNLMVVLNGAASSLNSLLLATTDVDHPASSLVYTITTNPANGRVELLSAPGVAVTAFTQAQLDAAQLVYVHNNSNTASDSFGFSVDDGLGAVSTGTFNILGDQPPLANSGGPYSISEGSGVVLNGLGSADPEGGALTYRWDLNNDGIFGDVTGASLSVNWTTLVSQGITNQGIFAIGLEVTDPVGQSHISTTTLTVNNLAPAANSDSGAGFVTNEDSVFVTGNVLTNDTDPNSNDTLSVAGINTSLTRGLVTHNGDGTFTYNPNGQFDNLKPGDIATDTFVYTLRDEFGATSFATVIVTINGLNDLPVAGNDAFSATLGSTLVVSGPGLLANDFDVDSTVLTVTIVSGPVGGTLTSSPNGSFTYTPNGGFVGNDSFTYRANDGDGNSNLATVSILVAGVSPTGGGGSGGTSGDNKDDNKNLTDAVIPGPLPDSHGLSNRIPNKADQQPGAGERPAAQNAIRMESIRTRPDLEWTQDNGQDSYWYRYWAGMKKSAELQTGDFGMLRSLDFISQNGTFWQSLDGFLDNAVSNASLPIFVTGGSVAFTTSITAGYLVWLIRGGQILTALMANIPAWRLIDPLPILGRLPVEDDEDDDSLATMLAESSEDDYTKTFDWSDVAEAEQATSPGT